MRKPLMAIAIIACLIMSVVGGLIPILQAGSSSSCQRMAIEALRGEGHRTAEAEKSYEKFKSLHQGLPQLPKSRPRRAERPGRAPCCHPLRAGEGVKEARVAPSGSMIVCAEKAFAARGGPARH